MGDTTSRVASDIASRVASDNQYLWILYSCAILGLQLTGLLVRYFVFDGKDYMAASWWIIFLFPTWLWLVETLRLICFKYCRQDWQIEAMRRENYQQMMALEGRPASTREIQDMKARRVGLEHHRGSIILLLVLELALFLCAVAIIVMLLLFHLYSPSNQIFVLIPVIVGLVLLLLYAKRIRYEYTHN